MPDLLLELFSEEIPAGMQKRAGEDLQRLVCDRLKEAGLAFKDAKNFYGARRLTLVVEGLPEKSADVSEERKGPRVGAPDKAIDGFLRAAGLDSIDQAEVVGDEKKGDFYVVKIEKPGRATGDVTAELVPAVIRNFPWPKSQRWGEGRLRWARPLHFILCLLGGRTISFNVDGIESGNKTRGHRFMAPQSFPVAGFDDYAAKLHEHFVILDAAERRAMILDGAQAAAAKAKLELVEDEALLEENAGLAEWPVVLIGTFDEGFLDLPPEVIVTAIKKHQKCFSLRDTHPPLDGEGRPEGSGRGDGNKNATPTRPAAPADLPRQGGGGQLANRFILVSNLIAEDGGKAIVAGNEQVVRARLSDAKFFWDQDRKVKLEDRLPELEGIIFHEKLGSQAERVERLKALARELAPIVGADPDKAERAAALAKADLVTGMVGEFPDLQGLMGKYYALDQGEDASVALAIAEHYKPAGQNDTVPTDPVSIAVALADKLDTLVGFWAIDEKPTGSKDPYALRRAALGVIRIVMENDVRLSFTTPIFAALELLSDQGAIRLESSAETLELFGEWNSVSEECQRRGMKEIPDAVAKTLLNEGNLVSFFSDRLQVHLRDKGARHDLIGAVYWLGKRDDIYLIVRRIEALDRFIETEIGNNLVSGVKRASNILRIEEQKDGRAVEGVPDPKLFTEAEEKALAKAIDEASKAASAAVEKEDFEGAMLAIAKLRKPVDAFFDQVTVNADDAKLRENRLKLLNRIREATRAVADFSKIEG